MDILHNVCRRVRACMNCFSNCSALKKCTLGDTEPYMRCTVIRLLSIRFWQFMERRAVPLCRFRFKPSDGEFDICTLLHRSIFTLIQTHAISTIIVFCYCFVVTHIVQSPPKKQRSHCSLFNRHTPTEYPHWQRRWRERKTSHFHLVH